MRQHLTGSPSFRGRFPQNRRAIRHGTLPPLRFIAALFCKWRVVSGRTAAHSIDIDGQPLGRKLDAITHSRGTQVGRQPDMNDPKSKLAELAATLQLSESDTQLLVDQEPKLLKMENIRRWHQRRIETLCAGLDSELPVVVDKVVRRWPQCLLLSTQALARGIASVATRLDISEDDAKTRLLEQPQLMRPSPRDKELREASRMQTFADLIRGELGVEPTTARFKDLCRYNKRTVQNGLAGLILSFGRARSARWVVRYPAVLGQDPASLLLRVQELAAVLQLPVDEALPIFDGRPDLLALPPSTVEERLQALCSALKVDKAVAVQQVIQYRPGYLMLPVDRLASLDLANTTGVTPAAAWSGVLGNPSGRRQAVRRERAEKLKAAVEAELGIQLSEPALASVVKYQLGDPQAKLVKLVAQFGRERVASWVRGALRLLRLDPGLIHQRILEAARVLAIDESQVLPLADKAPLAFLYSANLQAKVEALSGALGVEVGVVQGMVRRCPGCMSSSVRTLQEAPAALAQARGISVEAARQVLQQRPYLLFAGVRSTTTSKTTSKQPVS